MGVGFFLVLILLSRVSGEIPLSERAVFFDICANTNIATFNTHASFLHWCTVANPCSWNGVTCDADGETVTELQIVGDTEYVTGSLPTTLAALSNLELLVLHNLATTATLDSLFIVENAKLATLSVKSVPINGTFSFDNLPSFLKWIEIENTQVSGPLIGDISQFTLIHRFSIAGPGFTGELPLLLFTIFDLTHGSAIEIRNTLMSGDIPDTMCASTANNVILLNNRFTDRPTCLLDKNFVVCNLIQNHFCIGPRPEDGQCAVNDPPIGVVDQCFVCSGNGQSCVDCAGTPFGSLTYDVCGDCGGSVTIINDCPPDCSGVPNGSATYDQCDVCDGNSSSCKDCAGVVNGPATYDVCDVCNGNGLTCVDCMGVLLGTSTYDACDVCDGDGSTCLDCEGVANGPATYDQCDVCDGGNASCADCSGVPHGTLSYDRCDVCGGDNTLCGIEFIVKNTHVTTILIVFFSVCVLCLLPIIFLCVVYKKSRRSKPARV